MCRNPPWQKREVSAGNCISTGSTGGSSSSPASSKPKNFNSNSNANDNNRSSNDNGRGSKGAKIGKFSLGKLFWPLQALGLTGATNQDIRLGSVEAAEEALTNPDGDNFQVLIHYTSKLSRV